MKRIVIVRPVAVYQLAADELTQLSSVAGDVLDANGPMVHEGMSDAEITSRVTAWLNEGFEGQSDLMVFVECDHGNS